MRARACWDSDYQTAWDLEYAANKLLAEADGHIRLANRYWVDAETWALQQQPQAPYVPMPYPGQFHVPRRMDPSTWCWIDENIPGTMPDGDWPLTPSH